MVDPVGGGNGTTAGPSAVPAPRTDVSPDPTGSLGAAAAGSGAAMSSGPGTRRRCPGKMV